MPMIRGVLLLFLSLSILISMSSGSSGILLNTTIYLATEDSYGLYQGYVLSLKSVSSDGSVWLQLSDDDKIVKSEIVHDNGYLIYNRSNKTILSVKIDKVYSGSFEQNLVALLIYQFIDPDKPVPDKTEIIPKGSHKPDSNTPPIIRVPHESIIWTLGIVFLLILFYIMRKLW